MKIKILLISLFFAVAVPAMAQNISLGAAVDYNDDNITQKNNPNPETSYSYDSMNFSLMADCTYLRFNIGYQRSVGKYHTTTELDNFADAPATKMDYAFLTFYLLAKYPIDIADKHVFFIWPAIGIDYNINLKAQESGHSLQNKQLNDAYFLVGIGIDYYITSKVSITFSPIYGLNLTTQPYSHAPGKWQGERGIVLCGILYHL